ncbi:MAG: hypothetical protein LUD77_05200 [Clostridiales bacterium]|nr:hypothetical protein [Clostridiales bacterium]
MGSSTSVSLFGSGTSSVKFNVVVISADGFSSGSSGLSGSSGSSEDDGEIASLVLWSGVGLGSSPPIIYELPPPPPDGLELSSPSSLPPPPSFPVSVVDSVAV